MIRLLAGVVVAVAMMGAAEAQAPKHPTLFLDLKSGETVLLKAADKQGSQLCGDIRRLNAPPSRGCIALADIDGAQVAGIKRAVLDGVRGGLCVALAPVCLGVATKKIEAHVPKRIEKANVQK